MLALTCLLLPQLTAAIALGSWAGNRAAYFLDNNPAGSSIIALKISSKDGTLSDPMRVSTGGKGLYAQGVSADGGPPVAVGADTLFSQDSVVVSANYLFTVNSGSNTVSLFWINENDPTNPKLINTASTLGEFPAAVAYSADIETACVLNGGKVAGVACYSVSKSHGLKALGGLRPIALNQTTPPVGPPGTVSDLVFNPSSSALIATIKGSPTSPGSIYAYPVLPSCDVSTKPTLSQPSSLLIDFSLTFLGCDSRAVITDPAYGASIVDINNEFEFTVSKKVVIAGQAATCWSVYAPKSNTIYVFDGGVSNITTIDATTGSIKGVVPQSDAGMGSLDAALDNGYLYVLKGAPQVSVADTIGSKGGKAKEVQTLDLASLGSRQGWTGMAIYR
ncbi:Uncharacterized protein BP5553_02728 [Venustampulla echinocandica]|uniref:3-carboxy-cis,cis-mucoante lactonizing enzyme n=1 Tax=Venustampulla echinocandica TaxID=2656787 RepID=A0A370TSC4_9HELO|nr:Uncharacterized protein BP5553_02728 [Venustampulla echinocandica]RDL38388.1 Uncharacterized protein BP5553_02728 [Venustampulla echinocandica]